MAAVVDIRTASGYRGDNKSRDGRPHLVLIESPVDWQRIYLRRRLMAAAVAVLVIALMIVGVRHVVASFDTPVTSVRVHVVQPGETLWAIAKDARPGHDPRNTIATLIDLNSTADQTFDAWGPLAVGQRIRVPVNP